MKQKKLLTYLFSISLIVLVYFRYFSLLDIILGTNVGPRMWTIVQAYTLLGIGVAFYPSFQFWCKAYSEGKYQRNYNVGRFIVFLSLFSFGFPYVLFVFLKQMYTYAYHKKVLKDLDVLIVSVLSLGTIWVLWGLFIGMFKLFLIRNGEELELEKNDKISILVLSIVTLGIIPLLILLLSSLTRLVYFLIDEETKLTWKALGIDIALILVFTILLRGFPIILIFFAVFIIEKMIIGFDELRKIMLTWDDREYYYETLLRKTRN